DSQFFTPLPFSYYSDFPFISATLLSSSSNTEAPMPTENHSS
ncbi:5365_t:CDS:1, partial [Funneliformis geosporum]